MKILLNEAELIDAVRLKIESTGIDISNLTVSVNFVAGRKENGHSAEVDLEPLSGNTDDSCGAKAAELKEVEIEEVETEDESTEETTNTSLFPDESGD